MFEDFTTLVIFWMLSLLISQALMKRMFELSWSLVFLFKFWGMVFLVSSTHITVWNSVLFLCSLGGKFFEELSDFFLNDPTVNIIFWLFKFVRFTVLTWEIKKIQFAGMLSSLSIKGINSVFLVFRQGLNLDLLIFFEDV